VCTTAGYLMSYWQRAFFPSWCGDGIMDDHVTYDTMVRIAGSFSEISQAFKAVADYYGWTHIVLVSDDDTTDVCWYGAKPFEKIFGNSENYTFTWIRLAANPTNDQLDDIMQQIRSLTRGSWLFSLDKCFGLFSLKLLICKYCRKQLTCLFIYIILVPVLRHRAQLIRSLVHQSPSSVASNATVCACVFCDCFSLVCV